MEFEAWFQIQDLGVDWFWGLCFFCLTRLFSAAGFGVLGFRVHGFRVQGLGVRVLGILGAGHSRV